MTMSAKSSYLTPILTGRARTKYYAAAFAWGLSLAFFWQWWLEPAHNIGFIRYGIATACLAWVFFMQIYFIFVFLQAAKSNAPDALPGQYRVALITTKTPSEPFSVVRRTLEAMLAQDYPHDTWLADEAPSASTIAWCMANGVKISTREGVEAYHRSEWPRRTRCKEGNLAYFYDRFGYDNYDIVSQFDADHVPQPGYLREILRPFADPQVGYVSAPSICNANAAESWAARARLDTEAAFHGAVQCGYSAVFTSICIGSHYAVRTCALKRAGGLGPELAEDHSTSMLLAADGWKGVHAIDAIAYGDGPASVADLATQEFQWSRSLVTLLLSHTRGYLGKLPWKLKFSFVLCQSWYMIFTGVMLYNYFSPIYALTFDARFADVTYPAFVGHVLPATLIMTWIAISIRKDGLFRPYNGKIFSYEKLLFVFLQWPWVCWGCLMALRDKLTGRFVDFRVTPKGDASSNALPTKVILVYAVLAAGAIFPVITEANLQQAHGFHLLSGLNALIYAIIVVQLVTRHLLACRAELRRQWRTLSFQIGSAVSISMLVLIGVMVRGPESLYALTVGMEPFRIARAEYSASGAGMNNNRRVHYQFDPGWN